MAENATATNKKLAKFGASNFEYGCVSDDELVPSTRKIVGLSTVKMDISTEQKTLSADDGPYLILSAGITEATEAVELYDVDTQMKKDLFNIQVSGGTEVYAKNLTPNYIATLFKTKLSNGKAVWVGMLKGMFTLPSVDIKSVDGAPDPTADSITGSFIPRGDSDNGNVVLIGREDNPDFDFETFHKWVFPTTAEDAVIPEDPKA